MSESPRISTETAPAFAFRSQGLPQPVPSPENALAALRALRAEAEALIEKLIAVTEAIDGDPDREREDEHDEDGHDREDLCEDEGAEHDGSEPDVDDEPSLGWTEGGADCQAADRFYVDAENAGYVPSKADVAIRERLRNSRGKLRNVDLHHPVVGRPEVRLADRSDAVPVRVKIGARGQIVEVWPVR